MTTARRLMVLVLVIALAVSVAGCKKKAEEPVLKPKVAPPVVGTAGVLKAGVDLGYAPFAGTDKGIEAGIDVDVAAAIAERLGLKLELVDIKPNEMAAALNEGTVDVMLGAVPITDAVVADVANAGSYLVDGPAIFSVTATGSPDATITAGDLAGKRIGVQNESAAYWDLEDAYGAGYAKTYSTLKEAFDALAAGQLDVVVGDAAVGAYIARDFDGVRLAGQYGAAEPLGIAVKKDATELEAAVRDALDGLAADGTLDTIRRKWLGDIPPLTTSGQGTQG